MNRQNRKYKELPKEITLRGRIFTKRHLRKIQRLSERHFDKGRTFISEVVCEELDWKQPNGWLKDRACRDVLRRLAKMRFIKLPPPITRKKSTPNNALKSADVVGRLVSIRTFPKAISLELAKGTASERIWNQLVNTYHYLGHKVTVGRCLKYLVCADGDLVGAICFSSSVWRLSARDKLIAQFIAPEQIGDLVINNSRFLILPNVQVPNLASCVLSMATKQVVDDWTSYYSITPEFAETFVEPNRFLGTCYKAANWIEVGTTKGYAKKGNSHHNSQQPKQIFMYGLTRRSRRRLTDAVIKERNNHA